MSSEHLTFSPNRAKTLSPLNELHDSNLALVCERARMNKLPAHSQLRMVDEHRWLVYLLQGRMSLYHGRDKGEDIDSGSNKAQSPLFQSERGNCHAEAQSEVLVVRIEREQLEILLSQQTNAATRVHDVQVGEADNLVFDTILEAFHGNQLQMPALPEVALKVRKAVAEESTGIEDVERIVSTDPVLTARLIQLSNSPVYRRGNTVVSLKMAISRLGLEATRKLATVLAIKQLFNSRIPAAQQRLVALYDDAAHLSALAATLARKTHCCDPESAMLAGLVFDIGVVPILAHAGEHAALFKQPQALDDTIQHLAQTVSHWVLAAWDFDDSLVELPLNIRDWSRNSGPTLDLADLINAALLHRAHVKAALDTSLPALEYTPLANKLRAAGIEVEDGKMILPESTHDAVCSLLS